MNTFTLLWIAGCAARAPVGEPVPPDPVMVIDRATPPASLPRPPFELPAVHEGQLANGVPVLVVENHEMPLVQVLVTFGFGSASDPEGMEGLAQAAARMLMEGAGDRDALAFSRRQKELAAGIGVSAGPDTFTVHLDALARNLEPSLDLVADLLLDPAYPEEAWPRVQRELVGDLERSRSRPRRIAARVTDRVLYGDTYRGRLPTEASLEAIDAEVLRGWHARGIHASNATILVGGDTTLEDVLPLLDERLGTWEHGEEAPRPEVEVRAPDATRIVLVDRPGSPQSVVGAARFVGDRLDPDHVALQVANRAWGGSFTSRLNMNLREDKGYTYGARSYLAYGDGPARWVLGAAVRTDTTAATVREILGELEAVAGERPLSPDEVADARTGAVERYPSEFERVESVLAKLGEVLRYDLPRDWLTSFPERVESVTPDAAQAAFVERVAARPLTFVVVGDASVVREELGSLGLPVELRDVDGLPVAEEAATP